jgi:hypothetical protein
MIRLVGAGQMGYSLGNDSCRKLSNLETLDWRGGRVAECGGLLNRGSQHFQMGLHEIVPSQSLTPLRSWLQAVALQNVSHGFATDFVTQNSKRARRAFIALHVIVPGYLQH